MSTRCQIVFHENGKGSAKVAMIYQHYDGDPEFMIPQLIKIHKWFTNHRGYYDPSYLAARTLQKLMNKADEQIPEKYLSEPKNSMLVTGFGIDNQEHGDLSYLYKVYEKEIEVVGKTHQIN